MDNLDRHDVLLLAELQRDSRQTVQQLAAAVGLSSTPCWKRVKEMENAGIIRGYTALVDREKVGLSLCVLAEVNLTRHSEDDVRRFEQAVAAEPHIVSCYATTGQADYVIKVLVPDIKRYESFLHETAVQAARRDARALQRGAQGGEGGDAAAAGGARRKGRRAARGKRLRHSRRREFGAPAFTAPRRFALTPPARGSVWKSEPSRWIRPLGPPQREYASSR